VPSVFPWSVTPTACQQQRRARAERRAQKVQDSILAEIDMTAIDECQTPSIGAEESVMCDTNQAAETECLSPTLAERSTQTDIVIDTFSASKFAHDPKAMHYYTGLESYAKFQYVLSTLLPNAYHLKYRWRRCSDLSVEDQFFLTCVKLRQHKPNFELSCLFGISEFSVGNIVVTWINFMAKQWHELDLWPCRELVQYFMPSDFGRKFPTTRVILDGMECPIKKACLSCITADDIFNV